MERLKIPIIDQLL